MAGVKRLVYTSVVGDYSGSLFSPIVDSNRQTEEDVKNSGIPWTIGRNGIYLEPDLEYIPTYAAAGEIVNSANEGLCNYTSRSELAFAYAQVLTTQGHENKLYNLTGDPITQSGLAKCINAHFGTEIKYRAMSITEYYKDRKAELGEFLGEVIGGIYEGINKGAFNVPSDFKTAAGRNHKSVDELIVDFKQQNV